MQILQALPDLLPGEDSVCPGPGGGERGGDHLPRVHRYLQCHVSQSLHHTAGQPGILSRPGQSTRTLANINVNNQAFIIYLCKPHCQSQIQNHPPKIKEIRTPRYNPSYFPRIPRSRMLVSPGRCSDLPLQHPSLIYHFSSYTSPCLCCSPDDSRPTCCPASCGIPGHSLCCTTT